LKAHDREQEICDQSNPHLHLHSIDGCSKVFLHLQLLLHRFEEKFHLPPCFVEIANRLGGEIEPVGDKNVLVSGLRVPIRNLSQFPLVSLALKPDGLIAKDALCPVCVTALQDLVSAILFHPGDEEDAGLGQLPHPFEINIAPVHDEKRSCRKGHFVGDGDVMPSAFGQNQNGGEIAGQVDSDVQLHGSFPMMKGGPGGERQAELDGRGIQGEQRSFQLQLVLGGEPLGLRQEAVEGTLENTGVPCVIGIG